MAQPFPAAVPDYNQNQGGLYTGSIGSSHGAVQGSALPPPAPNSGNGWASATPARYEQPSRASAIPQAPAQEPRRVAMAAPQATNPVRTLQHHASGGSYVVQSGDTLTRIASRTGVSIDALKDANGLSGSTIRIGQKLTLPTGATPISHQPKVAERTTAPAPKVASVVTGSTPKAAEPRPEPKKAPQQIAKQQPVKAEPQPAPKSYSPPAQADTAASEPPASNKVASLTPKSSGIDKLRWPVRGQVVSRFGSQEDGHRNDGVDILVPEGTPIKAAENGVVIYAGDGLKEYGNTVLVRHDNGLVTVYGYAKDLKVKRGDKVTRGEVVADSGMSGAATRPKLHFEVRKDATPVNPLTYLD